MNILFHTAASIAISSYTASHHKPRITLLAAAFFSGFLAHGILDFLPHTYPIKSIYDLMISGLMIIAILFLVQKKFRALYLVSFLGNITPDIVDLGPRLALRMIGIDFTIPPFFPWHVSLSGSIYHAEPFSSILAHGAVLAICAIVIVRNFSKKLNMR